MLRSWKIGRAFGIDIFVHWSFVILPMVIIYSTKAYTLTTAAFALVLTALFATIIVMHEFGHIFMARAFGIGTRDIILTPLGGMARMERMSEKPLEEILISVAGPAVNVVLAAMFLVLVGLLIRPEDLTAIAPSGSGAIEGWRQLMIALLVANVFMGFFNMLPAFPMDGGRVFRAVLSTFTDRVLATTIAVYVGNVVIGLVGLAFFATGTILALPLAVFIAFIGHMELMMVKRIDAHRRQAEYERQWRDEADWPDDAAVGVVTLAPPEPGFSGYSWDARGSAWIEWRDGRPVRASQMRAG
jgi:Zn-dependent protease